MEQAQKDYLKKVMTDENQGTRKKKGYPVIYPLPPGMSKSVYKTDFDRFKKSVLLESRALKHNMEIDANEVFTKITNKNGFKPET